MRTHEPASVYESNDSHSHDDAEWRASACATAAAAAAATAAAATVALASHNAARRSPADTRDQKSQVARRSSLDRRPRRGVQQRANVGDDGERSAYAAG